MEAVYNTIVEIIADKILSFLIGKCSKLRIPSTDDQCAHSLQRQLLRARVIVEEAEGRDITNQAMVHQLNILRKEMYRGYYMLDNFKVQEGEQTEVNDHEVSHSFSPSKFNPAKRLFLSSRNTHDREQLQQVLENLNRIISDMNEFNRFLTNYSPIYRQPYSMHLFLDKCMFARQMEMERIMNFLVMPEPCGIERVGVLPIVGPPAVGKSTLVSHVCINERVRDLFSQIVLVTEDDLRDQSLNTSIDSRVAMDQNKAMLVIIELPEDIIEDTWKSIYSAYVGRIGRYSKIIMTSRSSKISEFGTTQPLILNYLTREAFWYFFKVVTFGSADPEEQPKMASMAMEIEMDINTSFVCANLISSILRSNLKPEFLPKVLQFVKMCVKMNTSKFGEHPCCLMRKNKPTLFRRMEGGNFFLVNNNYQINCDQGEIPKLTFEDVLFGRVECTGRINVLGWRSQIPPHKNYIFSCEILKPC